MPLDALDTFGARPGGLDDFRITAAREIHATLRQLQDGSVQLHLNGRGGHSVAVTVWSADTDGVGFAVGGGGTGTGTGASEPIDAGLAALLEGGDAVAVGCIESVKLQFEVRAMVLVHGPRASVLRCAFPREMFRFQRRSAFRVRPLPRSAPIARLNSSGQAGRAGHPASAPALRVLDVSISGCALFLPADVPAMAAGSMMKAVEITLDADTRFHVDLRLQHATSLNGESCGVRLGCEFVNADAGALRALQRFIDQTQKRSRMLAIS